MGRLGCTGPGLRVHNNGLGFRVQSLIFRMLLGFGGLEFNIQNAFRVWGLGSFDAFSAVRIDGSRV